MHLNHNKIDRRDFIRQSLLYSTVVITEKLWLNNSIYAVEQHLQPKPPQNDPPPLTDEACKEIAAEYLEFFQAVVYYAPTENQQIIIDHIKSLYRLIQPWFNQKVKNTIIEDARQLSGELQQIIQTLVVTLTDSRIEFENSDDMKIGRDMMNPFILVINNQSPQNRAFQPALNMPWINPVTSLKVKAYAKKSVLFCIKPDTNTQVNELQLIFTESLPNPKTHSLTKKVHLVDPAIVKGTIYDSDTGKIFPGKVYAAGGDHILRQDAKCSAIQTISEKPIVDNVPIGGTKKLPFSYSDGHFEIKLAPGKVKVTLERGYEYNIETKTINLKPNQAKTINLASGKFIDMKRHGWISGDTHVHWAKNWWDENEDIDLLARVQRAEDLRVVNNLTLLQYRPEPHGTFIKPDQYPMGPVPGYCDHEYHIEMGEEYRNDNFYGHICLLNIKSLVQPIATGQGSGGDADAVNWPLNIHAIEECRQQGGISTEAHNLGPFNRSDVPANAVMGFSDCLDQLDPEHYYRFLDCGLQLPLGNGSDHPARILGWARMYVKIDGAFTYQKWIDGIKAKQTFTTSGPLILLEVNGRDIGQTLKLSKGDTITINATAVSRYPLGNVQIVSNNGQILKQIKTDNKKAQLELEMTTDRGRWFVARCSQIDNYSALHRPNTAHTSAIYVFVDGSGPFDPAAARYWIDLLKAHRQNVYDNAKFENDQQRKAHWQYITTAIDKYEKMIEAHT